MPNQGALTTLNNDEAIAEIASGTLSKQIAARYGVTPFAVRQRLSKHPSYPEAIKSQADSFVENATHEVMSLNESSDALAIARARVKADTAFKWAAARNPDVWGNKGNGPITIDLGNVLQAISERMQGQSKPIDMVQNMGSVDNTK